MTEKNMSIPPHTHTTYALVRVGFVFRKQSVLLRARDVEVALAQSGVTLDADTCAKKVS